MPRTRPSPAPGVAPRVTLQPLSPSAGGASGVVGVVEGGDGGGPSHWPRRAWTQPVVASQRSSVHGSPSSQVPQLSHDVAPAAEYAPVGHALQAVAPGAANVPAAQGSHVASAVAEHAVFAMVPAWQTVHALQRPPAK
jgi:hypothetical protein